VGVVLPSDAGYRRARRARQGEARLHPRLDVVLEWTREYRRFLASGNGYDAAKQRVVATLFAEALAGADLWAVFGVTGRGSRLAAAEIFVCFSDFERVARQEAHAAVTADELARFTSSLGWRRTSSGACSTPSARRACSCTPTSRRRRCGLGREGSRAGADRPDPRLELRRRSLTLEPRQCRAGRRPPTVHSRRHHSGDGSNPGLRKRA
jgi:hypothetical protein